MLQILILAVVVATELNDIPDDVKRVIQADALHLYRYGDNPIAPILSLTETVEFFPQELDNIPMGGTISQKYRYMEGLNTLFEMPQGRYLTLWLIQERRLDFGSVFLSFRTDDNCGDVDLYYYDGDEDYQVLRAHQGDSGVPEVHRDHANMLTIGFLLHGQRAELDGRTVLLYIPPTCTLQVSTISLFIVRGPLSTTPYLPFGV